MKLVRLIKLKVLNDNKIRLLRPTMVIKTILSDILLLVCT